MLADLRRLAHLLVVALPLFAAGCSLSRLPDYPPAYREYAYVTNGKSGTVTVIDAGSYKRLKTIPVGAEPTGVAANPKKNEIYVVNAGSNNLTFIDADTSERVTLREAGLLHQPRGRHLHVPLTSRIRRDHLPARLHNLQ